jgi:hypothetical protein
VCPAGNAAAFLFAKGLSHPLASRFNHKLPPYSNPATPFRFSFAVFHFNLRSPRRCFQERPGDLMVANVNY